MNKDEATELSKQDALALAELVYDIYIEKKEGGVNDDQGGSKLRLIPSNLEDID